VKEQRERQRSPLARRLDLRVLSLDLFDEQLHVRAPLVGVEIDDFRPGPVKVVGEEEDLLPQ
jgi:hypothetical protein